jgi:hypothetical protein
MTESSSFNFFGFFCSRVAVEVELLYVHFNGNGHRESIIPDGLVFLPYQQPGFFPFEEGDNKYWLVVSITNIHKLSSIVISLSSACRKV